MLTQLLFVCGSSGQVLAQNNSFDYRAWNRQNCVLTDKTQYYSVLSEAMSSILGVSPDSIQLKRLKYIGPDDMTPMTSMGSPAPNTCWATFYTPKGAVQCDVFFSVRNRVIWRADCNDPVGQLCVNRDCSAYGK